MSTLIDIVETVNRSLNTSNNLQRQRAACVMNLLNARTAEGIEFSSLRLALFIGEYSPDTISWISSNRILFKNFAEGQANDLLRSIN